MTLETESEQDFQRVQGLRQGDTISFTTRLKRPNWYKNPGGFNYRRFLERKGIYLTGYVPAEKWRIQKKEASSLFSLDPLRRELKKTIDAGISPPANSLLKSLLVGDTSGLTPEIWEDFRITGTAHLLAISGQHIAIIAAICFALFSWLLKRSPRLILAFSVRKLALLLTIIPVIVYILLAGSPPSAVRAGLMFFATVLAFSLKRDLDLLSSIAFAAIMITLFDFSAPFSLSFQLSFLAVLSMVLFLPPFQQKAPRLLLPLLVTIAATLGTAPLAAYHFHLLPISGVLMNLWAVPFVGFLLPLSGASLFLILLLPPLGMLLLPLLEKLSLLFLGLLHRSASWSFAYEVYPTETTILLVYLLLALFLTILYKKWIRSFALISIGLLLMIGLKPLLSSQDTLKVTFIDVGQGDAALIESPEGQTILIDGGGFLIPDQKNLFDVGREVVVPFLKRKGVKKIDLMILSHPHPDHYGGLAAVVESFPIDEFWWNGQKFLDESFDLLMKALEKNQTKIQKVSAPFVRDIGPLQFSMIHPEKIDRSQNINNNCLAVRATFKDVSFFFAGDIEKDAEEEIIRKGIKIESTVLKIPHHGSRTSSSVPFIDTVKPRYGVVSLSEGNHFGFPHPGILEKYERRDVQLFRTDRNGAVTFESDGKKIEVKRYLFPKFSQD